MDDNNIVQGVSVDILDHNSLKLPGWLDNLIYEEIGANYNCINKNMVVLDWDRNEMCHSMCLFLYECVFSISSAFGR